MIEHHVVINEITPPINQYNATEYPGDGLYHHSGTLFCVDNGTVLGYPIPIQRLTATKSVGGGPAAISDTVFLKTLAILKEPGLILDMEKNK